MISIKEYLVKMHSELSDVSSQRVWGSFILVNAMILSYCGMFFKGEKLTDIGLFLGGICSVVLVGKGIQKFAENKIEAATAPEGK